MLLIFQVTVAIVLAHYIIEWPRNRAAARKAARDHATVDVEIARHQERHARNAAAKAALEPELAKLEPYVRDQFLIAWEEGTATLTSEGLATFLRTRSTSGL